MARPVFAFYGTLMSDAGRGMEDRGRYLGPCRIPGWMISINDAFPALLPGEGFVKGELWAPHRGTERQAFQLLDYIEGYDRAAPRGSMYLRRRTVVCPSATQSTSLVVAWTYFWNRSPDGYSEVPHGDWRGYVKAMSGWR